MFSVTRYCLNIDPSNRDLQNLQNELTALKYFTIDEEYWASDYEDENLEEADIDEDDADDDDDNDDDDEDEYFDDGVDDYYTHEEAKKNVSVSLSPTKSIPLITTTDVESKSINCLKPETDSTTESDTVNSRAIELKDEPAMPHNHRADALLSSSTNMKPIPISDGNIKFIRNTRKPFNVASYNQSAINSHHKPNNNYNSFNNGNVFNNRFNREDFFTLNLCLIIIWTNMANKDSITLESTNTLIIRISIIIEVTGKEMVISVAHGKEIIRQAIQRKTRVVIFIIIIIIIMRMIVIITTIPTIAIEGNHICFIHPNQGRITLQEIYLQILFMLLVTSIILLLLIHLLQENIFLLTYGRLSA